MTERVERLLAECGMTARDLPPEMLEMSGMVGATERPGVFKRLSLVEALCEDQVSMSSRPAEGANYTTFYTYGGRRYISLQDDFSPPRTEEEFLQRYPTLVPNQVRAKLPGRQRADIEDYVQQIYLHLFTMPEKRQSKYAAPGTNLYPDGCTQRIQMFNPSRSNSCTENAYKGWLRSIITNELNDILAAEQRYIALSLDDSENSSVLLKEVQSKEGATEQVDRQNRRLDAIKVAGRRKLSPAKQELLQELRVGFAA